MDFGHILFKIFNVFCLQILVTILENYLLNLILCFQSEKSVCGSVQSENQGVDLGEVKFWIDFHVFLFFSKSSRPNLR